MTDIQFHNELKDYLSDLATVDRRIIRTQLYCTLQPGLVSYGGHFVLADNQSIPVDIKIKSKLSNSEFADKIRSFHRQSTNGGLNKWNRALFTIDEHGQAHAEFTGDEIWERENVNSYDGQPESVRQKWYWEE